MIPEQIDLDAILAWHNEVTASIWMGKEMRKEIAAIPALVDEVRMLRERDRMAKEYLVGESRSRVDSGVVFVVRNLDRWVIRLDANSGWWNPAMGWTDWECRSTYPTADEAVEVAKALCESEGGK